MIDLFRRLKGGNPTADQLRGMVDSIDLDALAKTVERTERDRRDALLSGDERACDRAEAGLQVAKRDYERAVIARAELQARLVDAEANEARVARAAQIEAAIKARDAARRRLATEAAEAARRLVEILEQVAAANAEVQAVNNQLLMSNPDGRAFLDPVEPGFAPWSGGVTIPPDPERGIPAWNHTPPPFPHQVMIASAYPPGAVGSKGEAPRAVVLRPASAAAWSHEP